MRAWPPTTRWRFLASLGMTRMITSMKLDNVGSDGFYNTPQAVGHRPGIQSILDGTHLGGL
jgi:hypothetical protein